MAFHGSDSPAARPLHGDYATGDLVVAIEGGRVVTPSGIIEGGTVLIQGDRIDSVRTEGAPLADRVIDASDRVVMPGVVDVHGDDYEHQLIPRSGARMDPQTAFIASDRLNVSHGITTKAHAIAFEDSQANHRSPTGATDLIYELAQATDLVGTNVVHARFELSSTDPATARDILDDDLVVLGSLMHHAPGDGQYEDVDHFRDRYETDAGLSTNHVETIAQQRISADDVWADVADEFVVAADRNDLPIASHDDDSAASVRRAAAAGIDISEFPLSIEAAREAVQRGMTTVMGAPNLVRGESLFDNLRTETAIEHDVLDVLCADYHPPSLLQAAFVETGEPLHERVARVTTGPARMLGFADRGRIAGGARADLLVVDPEPVPRPTDVIIGGRLVMSQDPESR